MALIEKITKRMQSDRAFIIAVVSCNAINLVKQRYLSYIENEGYIPYYEMVLEIVDEIMFTKGSEYLKYYRAKDQCDWFTIHHNTCMDWYFIAEAEKLIDRNLEGWGE